MNFLRPAFFNIKVAMLSKKWDIDQFFFIFWLWIMEHFLASHLLRAERSPVKPHWAWWRPPFAFAIARWGSP
jgi:hypothetical protein